MWDRVVRSSGFHRPRGFQARLGRQTFHHGRTSVIGENLCANCTKGRINFRLLCLQMRTSDSRASKLANVYPQTKSDRHKLQDRFAATTKIENHPVGRAPAPLVERTHPVKPAVVEGNRTQKERFISRSGNLFVRAASSRALNQVTVNLFTGGRSLPRKHQSTCAGGQASQLSDGARQTARTQKPRRGDFQIHDVIHAHTVASGVGQIRAVVVIQSCSYAAGSSWAE